MEYFISYFLALCMVAGFLFGNWLRQRKQKYQSPIKVFRFPQVDSDHDPQEQDIRLANGMKKKR